MEILGTLHRVYVAAQEMEATIGFYQSLLGRPTGLRFHHADTGLDLALVGPVLILAGTEESLAPYRATAATFLVDSLDDFARLLPELGAQVLEPPREVPTGWNLRARHPDGLVVEYVQHRVPRDDQPPTEAR